MIRLKDVVKTYDNGTEALRGISFTIEDGEFVFLVGPSGSGKSTIIKLLTGEILPTEGRVMINGFSMSRISDKQIPYMRRTIGVIFQDFRLIGKKTVYDNLDPNRSLEIMTLLERINALGTTVVVVTHEKGLVNHFDKRVIMIDSGVVAGSGMGTYEVAE